MSVDGDNPFPFAKDQRARSYMAEVADFLVFLSMTRDDAIKMINDRFGAEALEGSSLLYHE